MTSEWQWYRESLLRRLGYVATIAREGNWSVGSSMDWDRRREELLACTEWVSVQRWMRGLATEISSRPANSSRNFVFGDPLTEYLHKSLANDGRARDLLLAEADFEGPGVAPPEFDPTLALKMRFLRVDARNRALDWMNEARVAWCGWAPKLDRGLFTFEFSAAWAPVADDANVQRILDTLIRPDDGAALVSWDTEDAIALAPSGLVRAHLHELLSEGFASGVLILPIQPTAARWAISYFHHDWLEIGRLKSPWPHQARLE